MKAKEWHPLEALIFDLDGVITDTAEYHYQAWLRLAEEEGLPFTREDNEQLRGVSRRKSLELLLKGRHYPEEKMQEMMERKNSYYVEMIKRITGNDLLPGAKELLLEARRCGLKTAVASASKNAGTVVHLLDVADLFDVIADGYSVSRTKPAPDLFIWTAGRLSVAPSRCAVFEDAEAGVEAALAAGMIAVGIGPSSRVGKAHFRYDEIAYVRLEEILGSVAGSGYRDYR